MHASSWVVHLFLVQVIFSWPSSRQLHSRSTILELRSCQPDVWRLRYWSWCWPIAPRTKLGWPLGVLSCRRKPRYQSDEILGHCSAFGDCRCSTRFTWAHFEEGQPALSILRFGPFKPLVVWEWPRAPTSGIAWMYAARRFGCPECSLSEDTVDAGRLAFPSRPPQSL